MLVSKDTHSLLCWFQIVVVMETRLVNSFLAAGGIGLIFSLKCIAITI